jgi:Putative transposase of IS4/5 family (DUF4096)
MGQGAPGWGYGVAVIDTEEVSGTWYNDQEAPRTGDLVATLAVTRRHDLTDAQWAALAPLVPAPSTRGRPPKWTRRQLIDGIRWRIRIGSPWRALPNRPDHHPHQRMALTYL